MSVESAKKFVEKMATDPTFLAKVQEAPDAAAKQKVVAEAGYNFDMADLAGVLPQSAGGELSDADLENVAGGASSAGIAAASAIV